MVQNVRYSNGPPSSATLPFECRALILSVILMNPVFRCSVAFFLNFEILQVIDRYKKVMKMSAENKINWKNAYACFLIDDLYTLAVEKKTNIMDNLQVNFVLLSPNRICMSD